MTALEQLRGLRPALRRCALAVAALSLAVSCSGCGALGLRRQAIVQGSTVADIQYQQVLDNLAAFSCNPDGLAWHIKVTGGVVQVADQGSGFLGANLGGPGALTPNLGLQRNVLNQWNVDPVIEADDLELLEIAYRKALNPLDPDGSIKRDAYEKICELANGFHITLTHEVANELLETMKQGASGDKLARLERVHAELEKLYVEIDELSLTPQAFDQQKFLATGGELPSKSDYLKEEVIRLMHEVCHGSTEAIRAFHRPGRNAGLVEQAQDRIEALIKLVDEPEHGETNPFSIPWVCHGCKNDVPPCACLVGRYRGCYGECYAWVDAEHAAQFRDFVLIILALAPPDAQDAVTTPSGLGAANSPNF
jgi:hypothetical protein